MKKKPTPKRQAATRGEVPQPLRAHNADEYRFNTVKESERDACCFYEFARESRGIRRVVREIRAARIEVQKAVPKGLVLVECHVQQTTPDAAERLEGVVTFLVEKPERHCIVRFSMPTGGAQDRFPDLLVKLADITGFPDRTWQHPDHNDEAKQSFVRALGVSMPEAPPPLILHQGKPTDTRQTFRRSVANHWEETAHWGSPVFAFVRIDLDRPTKLLQKEFGAQVDALKKVTPHARNKGGQRTTAIDRLNGLAALRLKAWGITQEEASASDRLGAYKNPSDYLRVCRTALAYFAAGFALSDDERPINSPI